MWKYEHDGRFIVGIPARDLTSKEYDALPLVDQEAVKTCGFYTFIAPAIEPAAKKENKK